jgi:hypothetical protein
MTEGLFFAKVMHSLALVDLGNTHLPNVLLDDESLQYILNPPDDFNRNTNAPLNNGLTNDWRKHNGISPPNQTYSADTAIPMPEAYSKLSAEIGPLGTQPSRIFAQYICSVPQKKGIGTVILLALVADFTIIQTLWMIFKFFAGRWVEEKDPVAMDCEGCKSENMDQIHIAVLSPRNSTDKRQKSIRSSWSSSTRGLVRGHDVEAGYASA